MENESPLRIRSSPFPSKIGADGTSTYCKWSIIKKDLFESPIAIATKSLSWVLLLIEDLWRHILHYEAPMRTLHGPSGAVRDMIALLWRRHRTVATALNNTNFSSRNITSVPIKVQCRCVHGLGELVLVERQNERTILKPFVRHLTATALNGGRSERRGIWRGRREKERWLQWGRQ